MPPADKTRATAVPKPTARERQSAPRVPCIPLLKKLGYLSFCTTSKRKQYSTSHKLLPIVGLSLAGVVHLLLLLVQRSTTVYSTPPSPRNCGTPRAASTGCARGCSGSACATGGGWRGRRRIFQVVRLPRESQLEEVVHAQHGRSRRLEGLQLLEELHGVPSRAGRGRVGGSVGRT